MILATSGQKLSKVMQVKEQTMVISSLIGCFLNDQGIYLEISGTSTQNRSSHRLSAAQRLEMLQESTDFPKSGRRFSGENLAARRAQFLRETEKSNHFFNSERERNQERAPSGRSTPMPGNILVQFFCFCSF